jgi:membrane protein YdbS with pleckstrin-like domain
VPERVERTDPEGVDYGRVMQLTFVVTILAGVPLVTVLSLSVELSTWTERAAFAVRVGAVVWVVTALCVYAVERYQSTDDQ